MINIIFLILSAVISYLLGSINTSLVFSKLKGDDIRKHGSKNAGATNTLRTYGKGAAAIVIIGDALKGIIAVLLTMLLYKLIGADDFYNSGKFIAAFFAILGHNFPVFFGFKGGKGILTSITVLFILNWQVGLIIFVIGISIMIISKMVSLGSCIGAVALPFVAYFITKDLQFVIFGASAAILSLIRHKDNIKRIINGTESKLVKKQHEKNI